MELRLLALLIFGYVHAAPANNDSLGEKKVTVESPKDDLKTAASTLYSDRYPDWSRNYPNGYDVAGYGSLDDRYSYNGAGGYDQGYGNYDGGYSRGRSYSGYGSPESWHRNGYDTGSKYGANGGYGYAGTSGYDGNAGYGVNAGYGSNAGYGNAGYGGNTGYRNGYSYGGNGGYGGYAGSGGLTSYYGYNNPSYPGGYHLGYGYYNKKPGYGNIYNSGVTPSLVTGYRGYSKK